MDKSVANNTQPNLSFGKAVICIVALVAVLFLGFAVLGCDTKVVFTVAGSVIGILLVCFGCKLGDVFKWFTDGARGSMDVILILMSVGMVIGTWIVSGVVPSIIYYGLSFLTPQSFILTGFALCCIVSFFIGSSYSTLATLGVAFMGIGTGLGINPGLTAGMVLSGSLFGDKMSPFSDTTNMAPAVSGTTVYRHINSMMYTVTPAMIITVILYFILSMRLDTSGAEMGLVDEMMTGLSNNFNITPVLLIIPVFTVALMLLKLPPVIAMLASAFGAIIMALIFQQDHADFMTIINALGSGYYHESGVADIDRLLNRGGIAGMMEVVAWTVLTMGMGEMLKQSGVVGVFLEKLLSGIKKPRGLVIGTLCFSLITACLTAAQYLAIMLPGMMLKDTYTKFKIDKRVLSRTLEDGGTMFSFLIPWDTAGIYTASVLGVATLTYAPYAFLLLACPLVAVFYACTGLFIFKDESAEEEATEAEQYAAEDNQK